MMPVTIKRPSGVSCTQTLVHSGASIPPSGPYPDPNPDPNRTAIRGMGGAECTGTRRRRGSEPTTENHDRESAPGAARDRLRPLRGKRFIIAGPGRVGQSLGHWLQEKGAHLVAFSGRRQPAAWNEAAVNEAAVNEAAVNEAALNKEVAPTAWRPLEDLSSADADVLILTVADAALEQVAKDLAARAQAPITLHVSGHYGAEILAPLRRRSALGSWHPLRAFTAPSSDPDEAKGITFAVDGDSDAIAIARRFTEALGGLAVEVSGEKRRIYHLAACLAAGGVATVLAAVDQLRQIADLPDELMRSYLSLTRGALDQLPIAHPIARGALAAAITGPAARRDEALLERQRDALAALGPEWLPLFDTLNATTQQLRRDAIKSPRETR